MIVTTPEVRHGKPRFVDTWITVPEVLEYVASGMTHDEILGDFPALTDEHLLATLKFVAKHTWAKTPEGDGALKVNQTW